MRSRALDLGSIGSSTTLHVLRRPAGMRRSAAFVVGRNVRSVCGRVGPLSHLELGVDSNAVRVGKRVVCVTCIDLDRAAVERQAQQTIGGIA